MFMENGSKIQIDLWLKSRPNIQSQILSKISLKLRLRTYFHGKWLKLNKNTIKFPNLLKNTTIKKQKK